MWSTSAWVFVSIAQLSRTGAPVELPDVLFAADNINRAIIRQDELVAAVNQLLALELITATGESAFALTPEGIALYARARAGASDLHAFCVNATRLINELGAYEPPGWTISAEQHAAAVQAYVARFAAIDAQLKARDREQRQD